MYHYFESRRILCPEQFGFRKNKSTLQSSVKFLRYLYNALDCGNNVLSVFLDFNKAFDSVEHGILLDKLYHYGVRGFVGDWLRSYLTNRKQYVDCNGVRPSMRSITHGVPQGSILGPFLFLIMINDLPSSAGLLKFNLFADDSTISYDFNPDDTQNTSLTVNIELESIHQWLCANKIKINIDKTKYMIFAYRNKISLPPIKFGPETIQRAECTKFLGLYIDENLRFNNHIDHISQKISKSMGILNRVKHFLPTNIMINLYYSFIHPFILYALLCWYASPAYLANRIEILQKKSIRLIYNLPYNSHTNNFFISSKILPIRALYETNVLLYFFKSINGDYDDDLKATLRLNSDFHTFHTRNRNNFVLPRFTKTATQRSVLYRGVHLWNNLPESVKNQKSVYAFKNSIRSLFFENPN